MAPGRTFGAPLAAAMAMAMAMDLGARPYGVIGRVAQPSTKKSPEVERRRAKAKAARAARKAQRRRGR